MDVRFSHDARNLEMRGWGSKTYPSKSRVCVFQESAGLSFLILAHVKGSHQKHA